MKTLTAREEAFAQAVADLSNPKSLADAYRQSYNATKMKGTTIQQAASTVAAKDHVAKRIAELKDANQTQWMFKQRDVILEWVTIATADPGELVRLRQFCCRHCHGVDHQYQWRDAAEYAEQVDAAMRGNAALPRGAPPIAFPTCDGGFGFVRNLAPVASCTHCNGDGSVDVWITPNDKLSPAGRKLFAGIKQTKDGIQVLMRDQDGALANLARCLGMFVEKREISGPNGGPIPSANVTLVADVSLDEATRIYQGILG